jgi:hypothetical protein
MSALTLPTLAEVCERPDRAADLAPTAIVALLAQAASIEAQLASVLALKLHANGDSTPTTPSEVTLISVKRACEIANVKPKFFYARAARLRFVKRLSPRNIRIDEIGLRTWLIGR